MDFGFHWIGVQKERMLEEDMYVLSPTGSILSEPLAKPYPHKPPKCSDCGPLFMKVYSLVLYRRRNLFSVLPVVLPVKNGSRPFKKILQIDLKLN